MFLLLVFRKEIIMEKFRYVNGYKSTLNYLENEIAIKELRRFFEDSLSKMLHLTRVTAPLFVLSKTGINDDLNGEEVPVKFNAKGIDKEIEIVHSLAKWKRMALAHYNFSAGTGLYTDMNAIRRDEVPDHLHSIYVDQWDWEKIITSADRTMDYLKRTVLTIVHTLHLVQKEIIKDFPQLEPYVIDDVYFITTSELEKKYPNLSPKERENAIARDYKVVFISQIGWPLANGKPHDGRAPDYDDWLLNGDLLVYHPILDEAIEVSSMGIRVNKDSLVKQLEYKNNTDKLKFSYHQAILNDKLPLTIGGGIGQSRICLVLLNKIHIGEVQASLWPQQEREKAKQNNIVLL